MLSDTVSVKSVTHALTMQLKKVDKVIEPLHPTTGGTVSVCAKRFPEKRQQAKSKKVHLIMGITGWVK